MTNKSTPSNSVSSENAVLAGLRIDYRLGELREGDLSDDPLAEYEVLPLATDVDIERAAGNSHDFLLGHEPLALAGEDDIQLEEAEPHPAWPGGSPKMTTAPGDVPMIFAARLR